MTITVRLADAGAAAERQARALNAAPTGQRQPIGTELPATPTQGTTR